MDGRMERERGGAAVRCSLRMSEMKATILPSSCLFRAPVKVEHGARRDGVALDQGSPPQCRLGILGTRAPSFQPTCHK